MVITRNATALVDNMLGEAYHTVKTVADRIDSLENVLEAADTFEVLKDDIVERHISLLDGSNPPSLAGLKSLLYSSLEYSEDLWRNVNIPNGDTGITGTVSIPIRKGQGLKGGGWGSYFNLSGLATSSLPAFVCGVDEDGNPDPGGSPISVSNMVLYAGPEDNLTPSESRISPPVFEFKIAGYRASDLFFTGSATAIDAFGGDGQISGNIFDLGVNHCRIWGHNLQFSGNLHYLGSIHYALKPKTGADESSDVSLVDIHSEYAMSYGVLFEPSSSAPTSRGSRNVRIAASTFIMNQQVFSGFTTEGAIVDRSYDSDWYASDITVRNHPGSAIVSTSAYSEGSVSGFVFDQRVTHDTYGSYDYDANGLTGVTGNQGATMRGALHYECKRAIYRCGSVRYLGGQAFDFRGNGDKTVVLQNLDFVGCKAGTGYIKITGGTVNTKYYISGMVGDGTKPLLDLSAATNPSVFVDAASCFNFPNPAVSAATEITIPKTSDVFFVTGSGPAINSIKADPGNAGRKIVMIAQGGGTVVDNTGNLRLNSNFVTDADDTLSLATVDGLVWFETGRSVN